MTTYKMLTTQKAARTGDVHAVTFEAGKTYDLDDNLAGEFKTLDAVEPSSDEVSQPLADQTRDDTHEGWLDTDPAVLRHGELTAAEVIARDQSPNPQTVNPPAQEEGKAEGGVDTPRAETVRDDPSRADAQPVIDTDAVLTDAKPKKSK